MVVNFRARGISQGARKLIRTPTVKLKKNICILHVVWTIKWMVDSWKYRFIDQISSDDFKFRIITKGNLWKHIR
jgi:hypothetical protein